MNARNKPWLKTKKSKLIWSIGWFIVLTVASCVWFYRAFDTAKMLDYFLALFWAFGALTFAIDTKELLVNKK